MCACQSTQRAVKFRLENLYSIIYFSLSLCPGMSPEVKQRLLQWLPSMRYIIMFVHRAHLAFFYINGVFYHMAKRSSGIKYVSYHQILFDQMETSWSI